ncbi:MAG: glycosyltransferase [Pseudobacter sp.]|uniref:glycosyltransferase n=1 Tax=Pseudobacter sp. TaxID=2045420 RepID=UPI003F7E1BEF
MSSVHAVKHRILIFCDWYDPGYKAGGPIQSCRNIVKCLKDQFSFYIITSDRDLGDQQAYPGISVDQWVNPEQDVHIWYGSPGSINRNRIENLVDQVQPDTVYFNSMFSRSYTLVPLLVLKGKKKLDRVVLAPRGMLHAGALQQKALKKKFFLQLFRWSGITKKIRFHATDKQEAQDIITYFPATRVQVAENIPNVDEQPWLPTRKEPGTLKMIFISRVHPKKNLHFVLEQLMQLPASSRLELDVYGEPDDPVYTGRCKEMASKLPVGFKVEFKGPLQHKEVFTTLRKYHLFVLPTLGENFGHAVFEALSAGRPILISDQTPWRNLEQYKAGFDISLNKPETFRDSLQRFLTMDHDEYNEWSAGAHAFANSFIATFDYSVKYHMLFK